jgi:PEP-CTERM motif
MRISHGFMNRIVVAVAGLVAAAGVAQAQLVNADVGINPTYEQTGPTTITSTGGFFSARAFVTTSGDYTGGTLTYGGTGSPATLFYNTSDVAWEFSDSNGDFPTLQGLYPTGGYTFDLTGGSQGPTSFAINYVGDTYAANPPELTAASFTALQGMNAANSLTLDFNSFVTTGNPNFANIVFTVLDSSNTVVFDSGSLSSGATSVTIPGSTLTAGQSYTFDLLFSEQVFGENDTPAFGTTQFYDTHTAGAFVTAGASPVPEPSTWAMMLVGFVGLGYAGYRGSRKKIAAAVAG